MHLKKYVFYIDIFVIIVYRKHEKNFSKLIWNRTKNKTQNSFVFNLCPLTYKKLTKIMSYMYFSRTTPACTRKNLPLDSHNSLLHTMWPPNPLLDWQQTTETRGTKLYNSLG